VSSAEQPLALPLETPNSEATSSPGLKQVSEKGASSSLTDATVGEPDLIMNTELDIPHNRFRVTGELLAKDDGTSKSVREMAHELRTPLNAIIGLCQCLRRDPEAPLNEKQRDIVMRLERNSRTLLESVNRLLEKMRNREGRH
jgi:signal transduction histidine kinase